jgi:hypothetical protein
LLAILAAAAPGEDDRSSLVTVKCPQGQDADQLLKQWQELPAGTRKKIESEIAVGKRLGLSSTGTVQLIGVYHHPVGNGDKAKPTRWFHLRQTDLFGGRLFWSILVNPEDETYRVLFRINEAGDKDASWLKLQDG